MCWFWVHVVGPRGLVATKVAAEKGKTQAMGGGGGCNVDCIVGTGNGLGALGNAYYVLLLRLITRPIKAYPTIPYHNIPYHTHTHTVPYHTTSAADGVGGWRTECGGVGSES